MNRKVEYALMALKYMGQNPVRPLFTVKEICQKTGAPFDVVSRVMQKLAQQSILKSEQGVGGGYQLHKDLSQVSFLTIIETVLSPIEVVRCLQTDNTCEMAGHCNIQSPLQVFNARLVEFYRQLPLSDLLQLPAQKEQNLSSVSRFDETENQKRTTSWNAQT